MKEGKSKKNTENPLKELDKIKLKKFKELEDEELMDFDLDAFRKSRLNEFNEKELKEFKRYVKESKTDINIENMKLELKSKDTLKNIIKELESMGINGETPLKLLKMIKKGIE